MVGRRLVLMMAAATLVAPLGACGRKARPLPPEGSVYPRHYPDIPRPDGEGEVRPRSVQPETAQPDSERK